MKVRYAALCETVLQDVQQRWSLIGIYTGEVIVPQFPTKMRCALYIEFAEPVSGPINLELAVDGRVIGHVAAEIGLGPERGTGSAVLGIPGLELGLEKATEFKVSWVEGRSKRLVLRKAIIQGDVPQ